MRRDGGPAFPRPFSWDESPVKGMHSGDRVEPIFDQEGMSLRDFFAAAALIGELAAESENFHLNSCDHAAKRSFAHADAMLKARGE